ncbi:LolA family protein [Halovenus marina]|uniref:LolA family protein n=1 Tax=Halovenus marina TaxID=3396621 RepID=UPI003F54AB11
MTAGLGVLLLLAGCSGLAGDEPELPTGETAAEQFSDVGVYNATVVFTTDNGTTSNTIERTVRPSTGERYAVTAVDGERQITVSNGTTIWNYSPADNEVLVISTEGTGGVRNQSRQIRQLFESVAAEQPTEPVVLPIFSAFTSSSTSNSAVQPGFWSEPVEVSYEGVERVSGRDAFVFQMESTEDAETQLEQTLYVDTEHYVVLRGEWTVVAEINGETEHITGSMRVEDIEFDPTVDDDIFEFVPPENATVSRPGQSIDRFESYDALVSGSDKPVPSPQLPADFEFESGTNATDAVSLRYTNGTADIFVTRRTTGGVREEAEQVTRNGRTYYYLGQSGVDTIQWRCDGAIYSVSGPVDRETLLTIGDSVECVPAEG